METDHLKNTSEIPVEGPLSFTLKNFATPIVFYIMFRLEGPKIAIGFALAVAVIQIFLHFIKGWKFSPYFILVTVFTILFGTPDLFVKVPHFFKLEAFAQNFVLGLIFIITVFMKRPLVLVLAESLPPPVVSPYRNETLLYMKKLTAIWGLYFILKAFLFLYVAFQIDLGRLYVFRVIIGNISAGLLFGAEVLYRKKIRKA